MADCPGHAHLPTFSWNVGMVLHVLKGDPALRDLEHVQVDDPGMAYLFFYDKQGCRGITCDATQALQMHMAEAFSQWISCSAHFVTIPLPLVEGWQWAVAAWDRHHHRSLLQHRWGRLRKLGVATLPGCPPHSQGGGPQKHTQ